MIITGHDYEKRYHHGEHTHDDVQEVHGEHGGHTHAHAHTHQNTKLVLNRMSRAIG
ncbi:MAG: hypothetical protein HUJ65_06340, partial [Oscillospiraceae bacterium]|nr:hypothetical protein [Oscillospiraceae bacterium]